MAEFSPSSIEVYPDRRKIRFAPILFISNNNPLENVIDDAFTALYNQSAGNVSTLNIPRTNDIFRQCVVYHYVNGFLQLLNTVSGVPVNIPLRILRFGATNSPALTPSVTPILYDGKEYQNTWIENPEKVFIGKGGLRKIQIGNAQMESANDTANLLDNANISYDTGGNAYKKAWLQTSVVFYK